MGGFMREHVRTTIGGFGLDVSREDFAPRKHIPTTN